MHLSDVLHVLVDQARFGGDTFDDQYGKLNAHAAIDAASASSGWPTADHIEPTEPKAVAFPQTAGIDYERLAALVAQNLQHGTTTAATGTSGTFGTSLTDGTTTTEADGTVTHRAADGTVLSVTPPSAG